MQIFRVNHALFVLRQRELNPSQIGSQQLNLLRAIEKLGATTTLYEISEEIERKLDSVSRQAVTMEKDGLIRRARAKPKSRLLTIELTEKGIKMLEISRESKSIDEILSVLTEEERQQMSLYLDKIIFRLKKKRALASERSDLF